MKGPVVVIPILELGRILRTLENHERFESIVNMIKKDQERDLARLAAFYVNHGLDVLIEPEVQVDGKTKIPDLMVTFGDTPVYFEAYKPSSSQKYRVLLSNAIQITQQLLNGIADGINFQIYLLREPNKAEVESLINACKSTPVSLDEEWHYKFRDLAIIMVKPRTNLTTVEDGRYLADDTRRFFFVLAKIRGKGIQKTCLVGMPFTDKRVDRILRKQYPPLSKTECNVVAMELTGSSGEMDLWAEGLMARFRGNNYRRIGAVILTTTLNDVTDNKILTQQRIISHPNPRKSLPNEFYEITEKGIQV